MLLRHAPLAVTIVLLASCTSRERGPGGEGPMGAGMPDDPNGRLAWEQERLRDPATGIVPPGIRAKELAFARKLPHRSDAKSLTWTQRGPRNRGGRTRAVVVDRTDPARLIAGGVTGGCWLSEDTGLTWARTTAPLAIQSVSCIAQDPRAGMDSIWYYGTGENYGVVSATSFSALLPGDGIFKSTDRGATWAQLPSTVAGDHELYTRNGSFKQVNSIVIDPTRNDSDVVLAAVFNGIFRSNDGGGSWKPVLGLDTTIAQVSTYSELRVTTTGVFYATISAGTPSKGVWRSSDGLSWTLITPGGWSTVVGRSVIAIDPSGEDTVFVFVNSSSSQHQLWKYAYLSGDGSGTGGQWVSRSSNLPDGSCTGYFTFDFAPINTQTGYDMCMAVHPTLSNVLFLGGTNVYRSTDAFATDTNTKWIGGYKCNPLDPKDYVYPQHHPDQHWLQFDPADPTRLYSANDGGVHITTDPLADSVEWTMLNTGYITSQFYTVHLEEGEATNDLMLGGTQDNGCWLSLTDDPDDDWKAVHQDDGAYSALPEGTPFILTSSQQGRLYKKTVDAGFNVTGFERIDPIVTATAYNFINPFVLDPADNNRLYWVAGSRLWRNNDLAGIPVTDNWYDKISTNWEQITVAALGGQAISALDISLAAPNTVFYGTKNAHLWRCDSLDSATPVKTEMDSPDWPNGAYVSCIAPNDLDADEWLMAFSNYGVRSVWHTTDGGTSWTSVSGNLEENPDGTGSGPAVFWALIYPTWAGTDDRYFVGTSTGLYSTALLDGGNTVWEQEGPTNIGNVPVNMIAARNHDGLIAVGTHGSGVFSAHLPAAPVSAGDHHDAPPAMQLWPNPVAGELNIEIRSAGTGQVELEVMDAAGRIVLHRSLGMRPAGGMRWTWDLRNAQGARVRPGIYVVSARMADASVMSQRMIVR